MLDEAPYAKNVLPEVAPGPRRRIRALTINLALFGATAALLAVTAEFVFRHRYDHMIRKQRDTVDAVQPWVKQHPELGYTWIENVKANDDIRFDINDIEPRPLSTDEFGVCNPPGAIAQRKQGRPVDIVGVGDSFMEMAANVFYERFRATDQLYYSAAIMRYCPAQYTDMLRSVAIPMKPMTILYGVFENDFLEIEDYDNWRRSGIPWFDYHSGTWCGPPTGVTPLARFLKRTTRGWSAFYRVIEARIWGERISTTRPSPGQVSRVRDEIADAAEIAHSHGIRFLVLLIPSKRTAIHGSSPESVEYDRLLRELGDSIQFLDLRPIFRAVPDPSTLYYVTDGHWNDTGCEVACQAVLEWLDRKGV